MFTNEVIRPLLVSFPSHKIADKFVLERIALPMVLAYLRCSIMKT